MRDFYLSKDHLQNLRESLNPYALRLRAEYAASVFEEEESLGLKGQWLSRVFQNQNPMDLEIGTGNGAFLAHQALHNPNRNLLGIEIKYKCLLQTVRRAESLGLTNTRLIRFHANLIDALFVDNEVDNVYVFFPDPWPKKKHFKNRLIQEDFLQSLYRIQKEGSFLEFKTDNADYFEWAVERVQKSPYKIQRLTQDLHNSEWNAENFRTHFENLWTSKGLKVHLFRAYK